MNVLEPSCDIRKSLRPEVQLLLLCSRAAMDSSQVEHLRSLASGGIDWEEVLAMGSYHRVFPLLYQNLGAHLDHRLPAKVSEKLKEQYEVNQRRMDELRAELLRLVSFFESRGIAILPVKGPSLAARIYENIALRPAGDLDLLVKKADIPAALQLLRECGYSVKFGKSLPTRGQQAAVCRFLYDFNLVDAERGFSVELHFGLSPGKMPFRVTPEELIDTCSSCVVGNQRVAVLNDEENLIYLCVHGGKHGWVLFEWVVGVAELLRRMGKVDERRLWEMAERRNAERPLLLGLLLADQLLDVELPPALRQKAADVPAVRKLAAEVVRQLSSQPGPLAEERFQWELCSSAGHKLRWMLYTRFQPERADIKFARFPVPLLYYLIKPVRVTRQRAVHYVRKRRQAAVT